ncbi:MAG: UPF0158 family protein [Acidimicrobiales bacterium]
MEEFIELVPDQRPAHLLARAIDGRGAFRRFKDTLSDLPELRDQWFIFHDARMSRRAVGLARRERSQPVRRPLGRRGRRQRPPRRHRHIWRAPRCRRRPRRWGRRRRRRSPPPAADRRRRHRS